VLSRLASRSKEVLYRLGLDDRARLEISQFVHGLAWSLGALGDTASSRVREHASAEYVHLGCGYERLPGFVNCDRMRNDAVEVVIDLRGALPFATGSVKGIFHQHFLEHVDHPRAARNVFRESARILRPGGYLRVGVPDLERYIEAYKKKDRAFAELVGLGTFDHAAQIMNFVFGHAHRFIYDFDALRTELELAGFREVRRAGHRDSADPMLNQDNPSPGRLAETLFVEARR
jgi:predicted SAM-dependent methyltransferase